eukprot:7462965-Alexandrium_andersonii.AAC.1
MPLWERSPYRGGARGEPDTGAPTGQAPVGTETPRGHEPVRGGRKIPNANSALPGPGIGQAERGCGAR